jgi:hypothetical protein
MYLEIQGNPRRAPTRASTLDGEWYPGAPGEGRCGRDRFMIAVRAVVRYPSTCRLHRLVDPRSRERSTAVDVPEAGDRRMNFGLGRRLVVFTGAFASLAFCHLAPRAAAPDLAAPFRVESGGKPIDMTQGSAAPCVTDFNGDGRFDLLLGQRGECKLRIYRNLGDNARPRFGVSAWLKAGGIDASLPGG